MQVELCEIPPAGAPEIPRRERIYAFPTVMYAATSLPRALTRGGMRETQEVAIFQQPARHCKKAGRDGYSGRETEVEMCDIRL
jgi:hypothetical protein